MLRPSTYLLADDAARLVRGGWLGTRLILPRRMCSYFAVPCAGVAWHQLRAFAKTQAHARRVHAASGAAAWRQGDLLHLWIWDESQADAAIRRAGLNPESVSVWPESLVGLDEGSSQLRATLDGGFEGLAWRLDRFEGTWWWASAPSEVEWQQRTGLPASSKPLVLARRSGVESLRRGSFTLARASNAQRYKRQGFSGLGWVLVASASGLSAYAGWLGVQEWQLRQRARSNAAERTQLQGQTARLLATRERAAAEASRMAPVVAFAQSAHPALAFQSWSREFALRGWTLKDFDLRAGELRLNVGASSGRIDANEVLVLMQDSPWLSDVRVELNAAMEDMRVLAKWGPEPPAGRRTQ